MQVTIHFSEVKNVIKISKNHNFTQIKNNFQIDTPKFLSHKSLLHIFTALLQNKCSKKKKKHKYWQRITLYLTHLIGFSKLK